MNRGYIAAALALAVLVGFSTPAVAQVCYTEADGTKHFVSSKSDIPPQFRDKGCQPTAGNVPAAPAPTATKPAEQPTKTMRQKCLADLLEKAAAIDPKRRVSRSELIDMARPECRDTAERVWDRMQKMKR
jgi:hypothetical protein